MCTYLAALFITAGHKASPHTFDQNPVVSAGAGDTVELGDSDPDRNGGPSQPGKPTTGRSKTVRRGRAATSTAAGAGQDSEADLPPLKR